MDRAVPQQDGQEHDERDGPRADQSRPARERRVPGKPENPQADERDREEQVIAAAQPLQDQHERERHQPSPARRINVPMERKQRQRQTESGLQFEVRKVRHTIGIEAEDDAADGARGVAAGERPRERVCGERGQHEAGHERDVVGENRRSAQPQYGPGDQFEADAMIGERKAAAQGKKRQPIPPAADERKVV